MSGTTRAGGSPADAHPAPRARSRGAFRDAVRASLESGLVRYSKRQELLRLADRLGLSTFEANVLIAEVQYRQTHDDVSSPALQRHHRSRRRWIAALAAIALTVAACALAVR